MSVFEQNFPELKDKQLDIFSGSMEQWKNGDYLETKDVEEFCLSKQRVKETIDNSFELGSHLSRYEIKKKLLKELGL